jgi:outer membrane immunogenic protein
MSGINCQHVVNALGTVTGRVGYAFDRSLAYVKAGGALVDTTYNLLGNTSALTLGTGSTSMATWGWTAGIGLEYALTNHWTTFAEYDYIGLPSTTVPFPTVAVVNAQNIRVSQAIDIFKMGVNYKFDVGPSAAANVIASGVDIAPFAVAVRAMASAAHWTGFYIGGNYGALFEKASGTSNFTDTVTGISNPQANAFSDTALLGGVQAGYNWQWDPHWLVGVEGDWDWSNGTYSFCRQTDPASSNCFDNGDGFENISSAIKWLGTARARLGAIWNNWLLYGTGGAALGRVDTNLTLSCLAIGCGSVSVTPVSASSTFSNTKMGWVAGIGAETMLWFNWSARAEWLRTDLGTISDALPTTGSPGVQTALWSRTERFDEVRLGLNYHY